MKYRITEEVTKRLHELSDRVGLSWEALRHELDEAVHQGLDRDEFIMVKNKASGNILRAVEIEGLDTTLTYWALLSPMSQICGLVTAGGLLDHYDRLAKDQGDVATLPQRGSVLVKKRDLANWALMCLGSQEDRMATARSLLKAADALA